MAEVFKARSVGEEGFEKLVAIKRILPSVAEDEEFIRMFVDEAKITATLTHPNLAQTFDLGRIKDTYFIAMEYVPGKDLRAVFERLKRRGDRMPHRLAAWTLARVCEGLDHAHRKRDRNGEEMHLVHRDVSPQNVMVSFDGDVKLIDFGIARSAKKMSTTEAGVLKGKFGYMSPEQVRGLPIDRRSDIFAAGAVLYELSTGERLFTGGSDFAVLEKVQAAKVTPPSRLDSAYPPELERIVLKALAREPNERHPFAADLAQELGRFLLTGQERVSREDLAAFMRAAFPEDSAREQAGLPRDPRGATRASAAAEATPAEATPAEATPAEATSTAATPMAAATRRTGRRRRSMDELAAQERLALERQLGLHEEPLAPAPEPPLSELPESALEPIPLETEASPEPLALDLPVDRPGAAPPAAPAPRPADAAPRPRSPSRPPAREPPGRPARLRLSPSPRAAVAIAALAVLAGFVALRLWRRQGAPPPPLGIVAIATDPEDAEVSLDGAQLKDPLDRGVTEVRLAPGVEHVVSARREGFADLVQRVRIDRGERRELRLVLQPPPGALRLRSTPPGARVVLDGRDRGATPASLTDVDPARPHQLQLEKRCFAPFQLAIPPRPESRAVDAVLEPVQGACGDATPKAPGRAAAAGPGFLSLASRPPAKVSIDGQPIGRDTPLAAWPLTPGRHVIKLARGALAKELAVEIRGGETHSEIVDLRH